MVADSPSRSRLLEFTLRGIVTGVLVAVALHAGYVLGGSNFRTVLPGEVYRCAQPSGPRLEALIRRHGIRTVVNLRGCCLSAPWYRAEAEVTAKLDVAQEDVSLSATRLPSTLAVRQLLDILDRSEYPILFHCHQGADRTGLASVLVVLLRTNATLSEGLRHLGPQSGHLPFGKTRQIDHFVAMYTNWLAQHGESHSPDLLRLWIREHYCPRDGRAEITLREPAVVREGQRPLLRMASGESRLVKVRCRNTSEATWRFQPGNNAGVHVWWTLLDREERTLRVERAGLFHATVPPGEHLDLVIPLSPLPPGQYELRVDLANEQHGHFAQLGNDILVVELEVS
jgi:protein tyrosine phosphatase (PTP) superfamily phosphohydrolase (DUF442 family)